MSNSSVATRLSGASFTVGALAVAVFAANLLSACKQVAPVSADVSAAPTAPGASGASPADDAASRAGALRIVWIDVEGGAATLLIAPSGETLLADTGWPGSGDRDAQRIAAVVEAEVPSRRIDHCLITHYHIDHVGGVPALARRVDIREYIDHGDDVEHSAEFDAYRAVASGRRVTAKAGDRWKLGPVDIHVVSAGGRLLDEPLTPKVDSPGCDAAATRAVEQGNENPMSVGFLARFGAFDFLDLGDLTWAGEHALVCPRNKLGAVDLWQVNHHGSELSNAPQFVRAIDFTTAVMDNGPTKGGARATFETLRQFASGKDVWQLHRAMNNDAGHNGPDELVANTSADPDAAHVISAVIHPNGTFTVTNGRTKGSRTYASR